MYEISVRLGHGMIKNMPSVLDVDIDEDFLRNALREFGMSREDLSTINLSYDDLLEIYSELNHFGFSTKYHLRKQNS